MPPEYKAYRILKSEIGTSKLRKLRLDILGVQDGDLKGTANAVNNMFAKVSAHVPALIVANLPAYLPVHGCLKRLFIDILTKKVILYFTKRWKPSANNQIC